jgi:natural product biosynthesis luciferase-like monooxygenase protein
MEGFAMSQKIRFSLLYFAGDEGSDSANKYRLLLDGAKFADRNGFEAVWTPERHFHAFGGLYPNPSVTSAALAVTTERVKIRAGSVVLPLHNPIRVAEEWALVDNLSRGRVAISFASGWHANDFAFAPENYQDRKILMFREIETVRKLWRGETIMRPNGEGKDVPIRILPRPIQSELPIWITAAGHPETFRAAGELGANMLTHLLGQKLEELAEKIQIYREAWQKAGNNAGGGSVTLMLHTFVGKTMEEVRQKVQIPFSNYLRTSVDLIRNAPYSWALSKPPSKSIEQKLREGRKNFTDKEIEILLSFAFKRYFETSGLFGTPEVCLRMVERLKAIGVDEVACLIDFGVDFESTMASLELLNEVRIRSNESLVASYSSS